MPQPVAGEEDAVPTSPNIISAIPGGVRSDPDGVASPENVTLITWKDSRDADRTLALGGYLYQYTFSFDDGQQVVTRTANDDAYGHAGFGYVVSHNLQNGNSPLGKANVPATVETKFFSSGHHAVHQVELVYDRDKEPGGRGIAIPVIIGWFVATGRDHPVWSVSGGWVQPLTRRVSISTNTAWTFVDRMARRILTAPRAAVQATPLAAWPGAIAGSASRRPTGN